MKKNMLLILILFSGFQCTTNKDPVSTNTTDTDTLKVYKPNIYLYPQTITDVSVKLNFPMGGRVTVSVPEYNQGWDVTISSDGMIDGTYGYLFYECNLPYFSVEQKWIVSHDSLESFFVDNMTAFGFNDSEIHDFTVYWMTRLPEYDYYKISPLMSPELDSYVELQIVPEPDSVLRLFYVIAPALEFSESDQIQIPQFTRAGFSVAEWGVILMQ